MKLAICQMVSGDDKEANLREIERLAEAAAEAGADLAVFPEFAMYDVPVLGPEFVAHAEALDGPFVQGLSRVADRTGVTLIAGMLEEIPGEDRGYNTLVAVAPHTGLAAVYRKLHLYDAFGLRESEHIRPGDIGAPVTLEVGDATVGMLTCYDLRFPEAARQHADAGTDVLVYPAAWMPGPRKEDHWNTLARARAIENTFYVAAVSQGPAIGTGGSLIVDPMGATLVEIPEVSGVAVAEIRRQRIAEVRAVNPCLVNRRFTVAAAS
ncbi:carbon-nitrogen hydrolase family protein [Leucobacter massiliensis]|uniref:Hydrolase n=1 Tax=Leucobacter massiliensis TaxID=1686285 RepID=A0A2S9QNU4_9MICO|nr:carbon-nitrogen hydrolase family protein [Leucobacter massiliensis]PRI11250.1 hydrolase [Leucobacter massiliensis]